jgi:hypothetical protein
MLRGSFTDFVLGCGRLWDGNRQPTLRFAQEDENGQHDHRQLQRLRSVPDCRGY